MKAVRKILLWLLVLVYAGQGLLAGASPCREMAASAATAGAMDMTAMGHAGHPMPAGAGEATDSGSACSCCDAGLCAMSHCQSFSAVPVGHAAACLPQCAQYADSAAASSLLHAMDSLYRPPICG